MTEIYINHSQAVLYENFSIDLTFENPYFSGTSDYSYDIEMPLPANFQIFGHVNKLESKKERTYYDAEVRVDNRIILSGKAVVTSVTDKSIKIQIASGNAQINLIYSKIYIDEIDILYTVNVPKTSKTVQDISEVQRDLYLGDEAKTDFIYIPYIDKDNSIKNKIYYNRSNKNDASKNNIRIKFSECAPMPYFRFLMKKVFKSIGYKLNEDIFENNKVYQGLYVCHAFVISNSSSTCEINLKEYLPHWTFSELIKQLENFFVACAVVDERIKEIRFVSLSAYADSSECVFIKDVVDSYEVEVDEDVADNDVTSTLMKYEMENADESDILEENVVKKATAVSFGTKAELDQHFANLGDYKRYNELYVCQERNYVAWDNGSSYNPCDGYYGKGFPRYELKEVNLWNSIDSDDDEKKETGLSICPIKMKPVYYELFTWEPEATSTYCHYHVLMYLPYINTEYSADNSNLNIQKQINGEENIEEHKLDHLNLCYNDGYKHVIKDNHKWGTYEYQMNFPYTDKNQHDEFLASTLDRSLSFRVKDANSIGARLQFNNKFNSNIEYHIDFVQGYIPKAIGLYIMRNGRYICRQIDVTLDAKGLNRILKGTFFRYE